MSGTTISGSYTTGITLSNSAKDNPATVTGTITVAAGFALQGATGTAWTVVDAGTIASGAGLGVALPSGGSINATANALISGSSAGAYIYGAAGTVTNIGTITASAGPAVHLGLGGGVTAAGGTISGNSAGILITGGAGTVSAAGTIAGASTTAVALSFAPGYANVLNVSPSAAFIGSVDGANAPGGSNASTLIFSAGAGAGTLGGLGSQYFDFTQITIAPGAAWTLTGVNAIDTGITLTDAGSLTNTGTLSGTTNAVTLGSGASLNNLPGGVLTAASSAIYSTTSGTPNGVINAGSITGTNFAGVALRQGGTLTNTASGNISGGYAGAYIDGGIGLAINAGHIGATSTHSASFGIALFDSGTISNAAGGVITSYQKAVAIYGIGGTATISNAASATITGGYYGVYVGGSAATLINAGSIGATGTTASAVALASGFTNLLVDDPGAVFTGAVNGGNTIGGTLASTLELASAALPGTISGLGTQFTNFDQITIDPGATWIASAANTLAAGVTLTDRGTLLLNGATLGGAGAATISGNTGGFAAATVTGAGAVWNGPVELVIGREGGGTLIIGSQGTVQTAGNAATDPQQGFAIAEAACGIGNAVVGGGGALLNNAGRFVVGDTGFGTLLIESGGTVITTPGTAAISGAVIAAQAGADGSAVDVVGAGSGWQINGTLVVGDAASGSLAIAAGGTVTADHLDEAALSGSAANVAVVGKGSSLALSGSIIVGDAASAELSILNDATVSARNMDVGLQATGTGNIDIEGTGSELSLSGNLNLGDAGTGVLTLGNGTTLHAAGNVNIGANGVLNQFGGTVDPSVVNNTGRAGGKGSISASVSIANSGTLFAASGTETLSAPTITGTGALEIDGKGDLAVNVGSVVTTQTVSFTDGTGMLTIGTLGGFSATVGNLTAGDSIVVKGTSIASLSFDASTHVLTLFDPSQAQAGVLQFGTSVVDQSLISVNGLTPCFGARTRISTERGEVPVEELRVGDLVQVVSTAPSPQPPPARGGGVLTPTGTGTGTGTGTEYEDPPSPCGRGLGGGGRTQPVIWLGHRTVDCTRHPEPRKLWPVRISAHAFGPGRPSRDLWLSPDHALYLDHVLVPVKHLLNGTSIAQVPRDTVTYYHVELPQHAILLANGLPAESYLDTGDRSSFANGSGPTALHPDFASRVWDAQACAPLLVAGPQLSAVRRRLHSLAAATHRRASG